MARQGYNDDLICNFESILRNQGPLTAYQLALKYNEIMMKFKTKRVNSNKVSKLIKTQTSKIKSNTQVKPTEYYI